MIRPLVMALALGLIASGCARSGSPGCGAYPQQVRFETGRGETILQVATARTQREKERGLMNVTSLPADAGMAFVWTEPTESAFWMKNTDIPLAIAFVDERGRVVSVSEMRPCRADPCPLYRSERPYVLAIEANAGWFERNGVGPGDHATLEVST